MALFSRRHDVPRRDPSTETKIARVATGSAAPRRAELGRACPILIPRGGPRPWGSYQGSAPGLVSPGWDLRPGRTMYRWIPLVTTGDRSPPMACGPNVDQARPARGRQRSVSRTLPGKVDPRLLPPTSEPARQPLSGPRP